MAGSTILKGQGRKALVSYSQLTATGSTGLGAFDASQYARFAGMVSIIGSATITYRMGINSGNYLVSSSFVANSGPSTFDFVNYGHASDWAITAINSQVVTAVLIYGESIR